MNKVTLTDEAIEIIHNTRDGARLGMQAVGNGKHHVGALTRQCEVVSVHHSTINNGQTRMVVLKDRRCKVIYSGTRDIT